MKKQPSFHASMPITPASSDSSFAPRRWSGRSFGAAFALAAASLICGGKALAQTTLDYEAESLTYKGTGATASLQTDTKSSGGKWIELAGNSVGDTIDFTTPSVPAGTYQLKMEWKGNNNRGVLNLKVDGTQVGATLDQYSSGETYPTTTFGTVTFASAGTHVIRLTVTGKNSKSGGEVLSADKFTFVGQTTVGPVADPTFSPGPGAYTTDQTVTISDATAGASIRYTTDGSTPTETVGTLYTGPISTSGSTTFKAIAYVMGQPDSAVVTGAYTINAGGGTITLFDGTSFDGWTQKPLNSWTLNSADKAMASLGSGRGFIYANNKYQFYRLRFEMRHLPVAAGSKDHKPCMVFFGTSPSLDAMGGIQFQYPNGGDWDYRPGVNKGGGPHFTSFPHPTLDSSQWFSVEVLVDGRHGTARLAEAQPVGTKATEVIDFNDPTDAVTGYFAFQMHNSGLHDEYRNVTIEVNPAVDDLITTK